MFQVISGLKQTTFLKLANEQTETELLSLRYTGTAEFQIDQVVVSPQMIYLHA